MGPDFLLKGGSMASINWRECKLECWMRAWAGNWRNLEEQKCDVRAGTAVKLREGEEGGKG